MKKIILLLSFLFFWYSHLNAQVSCGSPSSGCILTDSLVLSTGYNPGTNSFVNSGNLDPLWRLSNLPPLSGLGYADPTLTSVAMGQTWVIAPFNSSGWNSTSARIISPSSVANFSLNNLFNVAPASQPFRLVREFCVCKATNARIFVNLRGDDAAQVTIYDPNGTPIYVHNTVTLPAVFPNNLNSTNDFYQDHIDNQTLSLSAGAYTVEIELLNNNNVAMGVSLDMTIQDIGNQVFSHPVQCCESGTIYGQKILDLNCDGKLDTDENPLQGVTFELKNQSNAVLETATSDINGEFFFRNVPLGATYTVEETLTGMLTPYNGQSTQTVTLDSMTKSVYLTFFNCPRPNCCENPLIFWSQHPNPIPYSTQNINGKNVTVGSETMEVRQNLASPIKELRIAITDFFFEYKLDACNTCNNNPALWGSIFSSTSSIGNSPNDLNNIPHPYLTNGINNLVANNEQAREIIFKNPNGAILNAGDIFNVSYIIPSASSAPCCSSNARICFEASTKSMDGTVCLVKNCSDIFLQPTNNESQVRRSIQINPSSIELPRLTNEEINSIENPEIGMMTYDITNQCIKVFSNGIWTCIN